MTLFRIIDTSDNGTLICIESTATKPMMQRIIDVTNKEKGGDRTTTDLLEALDELGYPGTVRNLEEMKL